MKTILITGAAGFLGTNLAVALRRQGGLDVLEFTRRNRPDDLAKFAARAEIVFHLAGVNRPVEEHEFDEGNAGFTRRLCAALESANRPVPLVLASSIQAALDNPYGRSKKAAEESVSDFHRRAGAPVYLFRFPNVFGKWSRPNYNTVVATFCHNISRNIPVQISDRTRPLQFVHVDDITRAFLELVARPSHGPAVHRPEIQPVHSTTLGDLHDLLVSFRGARDSGHLPDLSNPFVKYLHSTYTAFLDPLDLARPVALKSDDRGWLFEWIKSPQAGQVFISRTRPGITRGNHYHDAKVEKFCVIQGQGVIRFRSLLDDKIVEHRVDDKIIRVVDIPPGWTHSIENTGDADMLTLFWANEIFDPQRPDTWMEPVLR